MSEKKRNTENYRNDKYCLMNFISILTDKFLMNESDGKELLDIVFGGEKYRFPYCYDGSGDQFCPCTERSKYNNFCDLAARMVYTKKTSEGTNSRRTCLFNGNSHAAMTGRLITQYYIDGFKTYEEFFDGLLSSRETCDTDAILDELYKSSGYKMDYNVGTARKLVAYVIYSFHPNNLMTFDEDVQRYVLDKSSFKLQGKGIYDIFWQVENSRSEKMCSRFVRDFADNPEGGDPWASNHWPLPEYISRSCEYYVNTKGGDKKVNFDRIQTVPQWVMPKNLLARLIKVYLLLDDNERKSFEEYDTHDELNRLIQALSSGNTDIEYIEKIVELFGKLPPEERPEAGATIVGMLHMRLDKLEKDHTFEKKSSDSKPDKGDNNLNHRSR